MVHDMKQRLRYTALLLEYAFRGIVHVWCCHTSVTWEREYTTISMTVHDLNDDEVQS